ncbi:flagellar basal body-associated FliL family protein [Aliidongia dinghuensis]|uniref:hypothetical protein n=1 Tax=Aliidongia dinghuensis TaxID=1867774 RepID=UPI0016689C82|nr:hypothetical protein [Aliidongia dinghuensis]
MDAELVEAVGGTDSRGTRPTDGKVKGRPSGRRKWLVGLGILVPVALGPAGASGYFLNDFNHSTAVAGRKSWIYRRGDA